MKASLGKGHLLSLFVLTVAVITYPVNCFAYRPFATEDAGVAGKGVVQLEMSWDYLQWDNDDEENVLLLVPIYGPAENIELSLEVPYMFHNPQEGESHEDIGDINIVSKFLIFDEKDRYPALTVKSVVKTNSGNEKKSLGSGDWDYSPVAVASKSFGDLTLHGMFGYSFVGDNGDKHIRDIYLYGFAADYGLTETFHIVAEANGNKHSDRKARADPISSLLGATYKVSDKVTLDGGVRFGFNHSVPDWNVFIGMTITP